MLKGDALLSIMTYVLVELTIFFLVPLGAISTQWVRSLEYLIYSTAMKTSSREEIKFV